MTCMHIAPRIGCAVKTLSSGAGLGVISPSQAIADAITVVLATNATDSK